MSLDFDTWNNMNVQVDGISWADLSDESDAEFAATLKKFRAEQRQTIPDSWGVSVLQLTVATLHAMTHAVGGARLQYDCLKCGAVFGVVETSPIGLRLIKSPLSHLCSHFVDRRHQHMNSIVTAVNRASEAFSGRRS